jgi:hypothetical protein
MRMERRAGMRARRAGSGRRRGVSNVTTPNPGTTNVLTGTWQLVPGPPDTERSADGISALATEAARVVR